MIRIRQTAYMEVVVEEITIIKVSRETFIEIALEEAVSKIVDSIIDIIYYYYSFNKRSVIYIENLDASK
jgi:hypothetical protein